MLALKQANLEAAPPPTKAPPQGHAATAATAPNGGRPATAAAPSAASNGGTPAAAAALPPLPPRPAPSKAPRPPAQAAKAGCDACKGKHRPHTCGKTRPVKKAAPPRADAAESASPSSKRQRRSKDEVEAERPRCSTPGCELLRWHIGPCSSESCGPQSAAAASDGARGPRPSRRAAHNKNYRLLADEIDEREYGLAPEPGRRSLGAWAAEDERSNQRAALLSAAPPPAAAAAAHAAGPSVAGAAAAAAPGDSEGLKRALNALQTQSLGAPCSLYASDIPYGGPEPEVDVEAAF